MDNNTNNNETNNQSGVNNGNGEVKCCAGGKKSNLIIIAIVIIVLIAALMALKNNKMNSLQIEENQFMESEILIENDTTESMNTDLDNINLEDNSELELQSIDEELQKL